MAATDAGLSSLALATYSTNTYYSTFFGATTGTVTNLLTPYSSALVLTGDFTIELWIYPLAAGGMIINMAGGSGIANASYELVWNGTAVNFAASSTNASYDIGSETGATGTIGIPRLNEWSHIAVTRQGNVYRGFLNGVQGYTQTLALTPYNPATRGLSIGANYTTTWGTASPTNSIAGYMSNLRILKGTALYTANFNVPNTQLTAIANTVLLTCQNDGVNGLVDNSVNNFTLTRNGPVGYKQFTPLLQANASVTLTPAFSTGTTSYTFTTGSNIEAISVTPTAVDAAATIRFNGNVVLNNGFANIASALPYTNNGYSTSFTAGMLRYANAAPVNTAGYSWTAELWVNPNGVYTATNTLFAKRVDSATTTAYEGYLNITTGAVSFYNGASFVSGYTLPANTWSHVAYTYDGVYINIYVNGRIIYTSAVTITDNAAQLNIGGTVGYSEWMLGRISNFRFIKGYVIYTETFTPPSQPLGLTQSSSAGVRAISGSPINGNSIYFNGATPDYLNTPSNAAFSFGTNDFTIEGWFYFTGTIATYQRPWWFSDDNDNIEISSSVLRVGGASQGTLITGGTTILQNTWYHIALSRQTGSYRLWLNGVQQGSTATNSYNSGTRSFTLMALSAGGNPSTGYVSNLRITKGVALYTTAFTPSIIPLSANSTTSLLLAQTSVTADASPIGFTITPGGSPRSVSSPTPFSTSLLGSPVQPNGSSVFFNGSTYLSNSSTDFTITGNFTIECWIYPSVTSQCSFLCIGSEATGRIVFFTNSSNLQYSVFGGSAVTLSTGTILINSWQHVAIVRTGTTIRGYVNGIGGTPVTGVTGTLGNSSGFYIMGSSSNTAQGTGYISNLHFINGTALFTANFVPYVSPEAVITNTKLLALQSSVTTDASTNNYTLTPSSPAPTLSTTITPFITYGAASTQFSGTALAYQQITNPFSPALSLGQGHNNFTAEAWVYLLATPPVAPGWYVIQKGINSTPGLEWSFGITSTGLYFQTASGIPTGTTTSSAFTANITIGQWMHLALTKVGTSVNLWFNGTYTGTVNGVNNLFYSASNTSYITIANTQTGATTAFNGFISNARVVYGKALYTVNYDRGFTPSTTLPAVTQSATATTASIDNANSYTSQLGNGIFFNGTTDHLTFTESSAVQPSYNATIEAWVLLSVNPSTRGWIINNSIPSGGFYGIAIEAARTVTVWSDSIVTAVITSTTTIPLNTWTHIAVTLVDGLLVLFINGIRNAAVNKFTVLITNGATVFIGRQAGAAAQYFPGYITNIRTVISSVYTARFSVPTSPLTVIPNTIFLGLQSSATFDASPTNATITRNGTGLILSPLTSPFTTYLPTVTNGNSIAFGWQSAAGVADFLTLTTGYGTALYLSGDFTVESWIFMAVSPPGYAGIIDARSATTDAWVLGVNSSRFVDFYYGTAGRLTGATTALAINTWYHVAATRQNGLLRLWVNGTQEISATVTTAFIGTTATTARIGAIIDPQYFSGYLSNIRLINGTAIYTDTFTPSVTPYSLTTPSSKNTVAVTGITTYPTVGNPNGVTYSGSLHFGGGVTTTNIIIPNTNIGRFEMSTYDFTIEAWFYNTSTASVQTILSSGNFNTTTDFAWHLYLDKSNDNTLRFESYTGFNNGTLFTNYSPKLSINSYQWYHVAVVRIGTTNTIYLNGIAISTSYIAHNVGLLLGAASAAAIAIGGQPATAPYVNQFFGYISNVRVLKGYGVYTSNFVPSTSPLTNTQNAINNSNAITGTATGLLALQNSTTTDASSNNLTLTATGSPTVSSTVVPFLPGPNGYSAYFNGVLGTFSFDNLARDGAGQLNFAFGTENFTIELWVYPIAYASISSYLFDTRPNATISAVGYQTLFFTQGGGVTYASSVIVQGGSVPLNTWTHIAVVRLSGNTRLYVNGVQVGSTVVDTTNILIPGTNRPIIGQEGNNGIGAGYNFAGYMSNLRIVRGGAIYTDAFTIPTSPLSTTQSSGTNISEIPVIGTSGYSSSFNGSSSYLTLTTTGTQFNLGATDFTVEAWVYRTGGGGKTAQVVLNQSVTSATTNSSFYFGAGSDGCSLYLSTSGTAWTNNIETATAPTLNAWTHIVWQRRSNVLEIYLNGVLQAISAGTAAFSGTVFSSTRAIEIGTQNGSGYLTGYLSNLRVVKSQALYSSTFTPSTTPFTTTSQGATASNVSLLTVQNATINDNSNNSFFLTNVGGVTPTIAFSPFPVTQLLMFQTPSVKTDASINGFNLRQNSNRPQPISTENVPFSPFVNTNGRSVFFTGNSQYIQAPSNAVFTFGTDDFTIEGWIYLASGTTGTLYDARTGATTVSAQIYVASNIVNYAVAGVSVITGATLLTTTWYHIAVVRISGVTRLYVNGLQSGNSYTDTNNYVIGAPFIGTGFGSSNPLNGYISNLRVVDGIGVYSNNFVVPNTVLTSTQSANTSVIALGNQIPSLGGSVYFNGTTDFIRESGNITTMGTGDFTIETYYYPTSFATTNTLFGQMNLVTAGLGYWYVQIDTAGIITVGYNGSSVPFNSTTRLLVNEWYHIALVRNTAATPSITLYVNGAVYGTITYNNTFGRDNIDSPLYIGAQGSSNSPSNYAIGYFSNLRIVKGVAVYTGAFTVPTSPLGATQSSGTNISAITGTSTSLLLFQNSPFTDNSTFANTVTPLGNPLFTPVFSPSFFTYPTPANANSGYFNGTNSFLSLTQPSNAGTADFTIELWVYPTSLAAIGYLLSTSTILANCFHLWITTTGTINLAIDSATASITSVTPSLAKINTWTHIAITRTSGVVFMYVNGFRQGTTPAKTTQFGDTGVLNIGRYQPTPGQFFTGYITNVRFVYGTPAVYTGNPYSAPPYITPLTAITNTTLLLLQTTLIKDNSTNNVTVTNTNVILSTYTNPYTMMDIPVLLTGQTSRDVTSTTGFRDSSMYNATLTSGSLSNASYQPGVSPFGITPTLLLGQSSTTRDNSINNYPMVINGTTNLMPYVTPFSGSAIAFNGTTQYITGTSLYSGLGGDFTIEFFMMAGPQTATTATTGGLLLGKNANWSTTANNNYYIMCSAPGGAGRNAAQTIQIYNSLISTTSPVYVGVTPVCDSKWHHIAIVRIDTVVRIYIDGVLDANPLNGFNNNGVWDYSSYTIGSNPNDGGSTVAQLAYNGMLSNLRIINGTGIYTGTFTPPTNNLTTSQTSRTNVVQYTPTLPSSTGYSLGFNNVYGNLRIRPAPSLNFGRNDFTIELWHFLASRASSNFPTLFTNGTNSPGTLTMWAGDISYNSTKYQIDINGGGRGSNQFTSNATITYGKWMHIAVVRRSGTLFLYINGILDSSATANYSIYSPDNRWYIGGGEIGQTDSYLSGYISNFRVVNGIAVYSGTNTSIANFTVPTSPLATTQNSSTNIASISTALVANGGAVWYSGAGSAGYQTISGHYILNASLNNLTVEGWVFLSAMPTANTWASGVSVMFDTTQTSSLTVGIKFVIGSNNIFAVINNTLYGGYLHNMISGTWYHLAYVISNRTLIFFVNGFEVGEVPNIPINISSTAIGTNYIATSGTNGGYGLNGYISNLRIVKGYAVYVGNFSPSTSPLTNTQSAVTNINAISGTSTSLLALQTAVTTDSSSNEFTLTAGGSPSLNTTIYPSFTTTNGSSAFFQTMTVAVQSGSITVPNTASIAGSGTFTIECWIFPIPFVSTAYQIIVGNDTATALNAFGININGTIFYGYSPFSTYGAAGTTSSSYTVVFNAWNHLALVRDASTGKISLYINGSEGFTGTNNINYPTGNIRIGTESGGTTFTFTGHVSNLRIVNGITVYTTNFVPPTQPLSIVQNANTNGLPSSELVTNAWSGFFNGAGTFLTLPNDKPQFILGNNNFTIEFWFYSTVVSQSAILVDFRPSGVQGFYPTIYLSGGPLTYYVNSANQINGSSPTNFVWNHCALVKNNGITLLYLNGVATGNSYTDSNAYLVSLASPPVIGTSGNSRGAATFNGYISNLRIVNGSALYTNTFTPPTTNLTATQSSGTNIGAILAPTTSNGYHGYYFSGSTSQYLSVPGAPFVFGTSAFTVECWVYTLSLATTQVFVDNWVNTTFVVGQWTLLMNVTTGTVTFRYATGTATQVDITTTSSIRPGLWTHIAVVRSNTSANGFAIYLNGIVRQLATLSVSIGTNATSSIGILTSNKTIPLNGFISNVRMTSGVAVYTGEFLPQGSPLTVTQSAYTGIQSDFLALQSSTTTDASANALTLVPTGGPIRTVLSPFPVTNGVGIFYNGTAYQYFPVSAGHNFNVGDFTVEIWVYTTSVTGTQAIVVNNNSNNDTGFQIQLVGTQLRYGGANTFTSVDASLFLNSWIHVAWVRINGVENLYINGILSSTTARLLNYTVGLTFQLYVGYHPAVGSAFNGYLSNLRIVKGLGVYTGNFTSPIEPLTLTQTSSTNISAITNTAPANGASVNFNGSSYLSTQGNSQLAFGDIPHTIEFWMNVTSVGVSQCIYDLRGGITNNPASYIYTNTNGSISYGVGSNTTIITSNTAVITMVANRWYHVAVSRINKLDGGVSMYIDGVQVGTGTDSATHSQTGLRIGQYSTGTNSLTGNISNFRIVVGSGLYTANFAPSSTPLTAITNTVILVLQNSITTDASLVNYTLAATGTVTLSTTVSPFIYTTQLLTLRTTATADASANNLVATLSGSLPAFPLFGPFSLSTGYSIYFRGSDQYINAPSNAIFQFSTGDFTIEGWIYLVTNTITGTLYDSRTSINSVSPRIYIEAGILFYAVGNTNVIRGLAITPNIWYHIAVVRDSGRTSLYMNGIQTSNIYADTNNYVIGSPFIGTGFNGSNPLNGYITNLRVDKGVSVYNNYYFDVTTIPLTVTVGGNIASIPALSNTTNGYYAYSFNGTTEYLTVPSNQALAFGTGDFTWEAWIYPTRTPGAVSQAIFDTRPASTNGAYFLLYLNSSLTLNLWVSSLDRITSSAIALGSWYHVSVVRASGTTKMYVNGTQVGTNYTDSTNYVITSISIIGASYAAGASITNYFAGFISNLRITKGVAVYTGNFTAPTSPLAATQSSGTNITAITGTAVSLLTAQSSTIIDNSAVPLTITNIGPVTTNIAIGLFGNNSGVSLLTAQSSTIVDNSAVPLPITNFGTVTTAPVIHLFNVNKGVNHLLTLQNNTFIDNSFNNFSITNAGSTRTFPGPGLFGTALINLLALQNSLTTDSGYYNLALTTNNAVQLDAKSPFVATAGRSVFFNGSNQYLVAPSNAAFTFGTGDFTIEGWIYLTGATRTGTLYDSRTGATTVSPQVYINNNIVFYAVAGTNVITGPTIVASTWYHVAVVRISAVTKLYVNGTQSGINYADTNNYVIGSPDIGEGFGSSFPLTGYISNLRVVKGTGVYAFNFTVPTNTLTTTQNSIASTRALAAIPTSGYYSGWFDGTSGYLSFPRTSIGAISGIGFTVEAWVFFNNYSTGTGAFNIALFSTVNTTPNAGFIVNFIGTATSITGLGVFAYSTPANINTSFNFNFSLGTWYHVAATKTPDGVFTMYVNGTTLGSFTNTQNWIDHTTYYIGYNGQATTPYYMPGFISNFRITLGQSNYTTNFTPSATPLTLTQTANTSGNPSLAIAQSTSTGYYNLVFTGSTSQYVTVPGAAYVFGTNPFTVECWVYATSFPTTPIIVDNFTSATSGSYVIGSWQIYLSTTTGLVNFQYATGASTLINIGTTNAVPLTTWTHIAAVRSSTAANGFAIYINGVAGVTATLSQNIGVVNTSSIGLQFVTKSVPFNGYITNVRFTYGVAVYTAGVPFIPQTTPLTTTQSSGGLTPSVLLALQNGITTDASRNNFTLTATGSPTLSTTVSPFAGTPTNGNSVFFTGASQYLNAPSNAVFTFGTGNFTIEGWMYLASGTTSGTLFDNRTGASTVSSQIYVTFNTAYYAVAGVNVITGGSINTGTWYHIAVVKSSGSTKMYINGTQSGSTYTDANNYVIGSPFIGTGFSSSNPLNGFITNLRVFNGISIYTSNFTPSAVPLGSTTAGTTVAITAPTTTDGYYATAHYTQLTPQYLSLPGTPFVFGTSAFTVECWVYLSSFAANQVIIDNYVTGPSGSFTIGQWQLWCNTSGAINFTTASAAGIAGGITTTSFVALNTWTHIAAVRSSTAASGFVIYINGVAGVTGTLSISVGANATSSIGIQTFNKTFPTVGMISNVRVTNLAVYTGAFTVPTGPLGATQSSGTNIAAITGTSVALLTCQSATIVDNSTFAVSITNFGSVADVIAYGLFNNNTGVSLLTAQNNNTVIVVPATAGSSLTAQNQVAFNGTTQYLTTPSTANYSFNADFTVEGWVYVNSNGNNTIFTLGTGGTSTYWMWEITPTRSLSWSTNPSANWNWPFIYATSASAIPLTAWTHIAAVRSGINFSMYVNGTSVYSTNSYQAAGAGGTLFVGTYYNNYNNDGSYFRGNISNLRIVKGVAVYTGGFSTPTAQLTAITNTVLLICSSATFTDLSPNGVTITPVNSPVITTSPTLTLTQGGAGAQTNSTVVADNSVNGLLLTNFGPAATTQLYGLFGTSITGLLALHTILTSGDSSFSTSGIVLTQVGTAYLERSFSPLSANNAPSLLTNQSVANNDTSMSSAIITNTTLNSTVAYQVTVNPFGITAPTALLTAQSNVLLSDTTGFSANFLIENLGGNMVLDTNFGPFNNDVPLLALQNAIVIDNSNNRGRMTAVGGGVSPTDTSPFSNKSLTSLLIPYGYNDVSISNTYSTTGQLANSYVANNANTAITNTVFNPYVIPSTVVSVLGLQTSNTLLESSIYNSTFTTSGTAPTSNTSSPFGTYNGNGTLILNTSYTTGISGSTLNYANLVITSPDTTVTNTYSITISANSTTNIGNRINIETGYNINLANANITIVDVANSNISEATILTFANTSITPAVDRIDYGFSIAPSNATFIITDVANSNLSESLNSIFVNNVSTTKEIFDTGVITIRPSNINFVITDVANSNLAETVANVFVSNVRTTREIVDTGAFPVPSPVGGTVLFPTYAYTDGVPISAANVQSGGGGSSTSSNQQIWYQT